MFVTLNGDRREVGSKTLDALLSELELAPDAVATALNGEFVPRFERVATLLSEGDAIELLSPMQGG